MTERQLLDELKTLRGYELLKQFLQGGINRSLNTAKMSNSDDTLRAVGEYKAYDAVLKFVEGNNTST